MRGKFALLSSRSVSVLIYIYIEDVQFASPANEPVASLAKLTPFASPANEPQPVASPAKPIGFASLANTTLRAMCEPRNGLVQICGPRNLCELRKRAVARLRAVNRTRLARPAV